MGAVIDMRERMIFVVLESGRDLDVIARLCASRIWKHGMGSLGLRFLACMPC